MRLPSDCGKFTVKDPPERVPNVVSPPRKLTVIVDPFSVPVTESVWLVVLKSGAWPVVVTAWADPLREPPWLFHWMKTTKLLPFAKYPVPTAGLAFDEPEPNEDEGRTPK